METVQILSARHAELTRQIALLSFQAQLVENELVEVGSNDFVPIKQYLSDLGNEIIELTSDSELVEQSPTSGIEMVQVNSETFENIAVTDVESGKSLIKSKPSKTWSKHGKGLMEEYLSLFSSHPKTENIVVIRAVDSTEVFIADDVFGKLLFGSKFNPLHPYSVIFYVILVLMYSIAALISYLGLWNVLPRDCCYASFFTYPLLIYNWLIFNRVVVKVVSKQFQTLMIIFWAFIYFLALLTMARREAHHVGVSSTLFATLFSFIDLSFFDALPTFLRKHMLRIFMNIFVFFTVIMWIAIYYNWMAFEDIEIQSYGQIRMSASGVAASSLQNIIIFSIVSVTFSFFHPNRLAAVKYPVEIASAQNESERLKSEMGQLHALALKHSHQTHSHHSHHPSSSSSSSLSDSTIRPTKSQILPQDPPNHPIETPDSSSFPSTSPSSALNDSPISPEDTTI